MVDGNSPHREGRSGSKATEMDDFPLTWTLVAPRFRQLADQRLLGGFFCACCSLMRTPVGGAKSERSGGRSVTYSS